MIEFRCPDDILQALDTELPRWVVIKDKISSSNNKILKLSHTTTRHKLDCATLYIIFMQQVYDKEGWLEKIDQFLIRTFGENILSHLSGALDAMAHEICQIYQIPLPLEKVQIDHLAGKNNPNCLRCLIQKNDAAFAGFLDTEFPQRPIPKNHWYYAFSEYRNHGIHRTLPIMMAGPKAMILPDEPTNLDPRVELKDHTSPTYYFDPDYHEQREIKDYCMRCIDNVKGAIERTYAQLESKI